MARGCAIGLLLIGVLLAGAAPGTATASRQAALDALHNRLGREAVVELDEATGAPRVVADLDGYLTGPTTEGPAEAVKQYLRERPGVFGLDGGDLAELRVADAHELRQGVSRIVFEQTVSGVPVLGGGLIAIVTGSGRIAALYGPAIPDLSLASTQPAIGAGAALDAATAAAGGGPGAASGLPAPSFPGGGPARLVVDATGPAPHLAWRTLVRDGEGRVHEIVVDAQTGRLRDSRDLSTDAVQANVFDYYPGAASGGSEVTRDISSYVTTPGDDELLGPFAYAFSDVNDSGVVGAGEDVPVSGGDDYLYPYVPFNLGSAGNCPPTPYHCSWDTTDPFSWESNVDRAAVQLFYQANRFHDHLLTSPIEFTAAKGAYEGARRMWLSANHGANTGTGALAGLPDGNNLNNAFFSPNPGGPPIIFALLFGPDTYVFGSNARSPDMPTVNGADDGPLILHEYTHGLSSALFTDADGVETLEGHQARSMGEAWSDWYAMDFIVEKGHETDTATSGEIVFSEYTPGGRFQALDCAVGASAGACPAAGTAGSGGFTYGDMGNIFDAPETHSDGEIWAQTLWDLRRRLIADHGAAEGLARTRLLVTAGMEVSPPDPSFLDQRNAILQADFLFNGGQDEARIWDVFAARGMGWFASTFDAADTEPIQNFSLPPPSGAGTMSGTVRAESGDPVEDARVSVGGFAYEHVDFTDASGHFSLSGLPPGTYPELLVDPEPGLDAAIAQNVTVTNGGNVTRDLVMRRNWIAQPGGAEITGVVGPSPQRCAAVYAIDQTFARGWGTTSPADPVDPGAKSFTVRLPRAVDITSFAMDPSAAGCFDGYTASIGSWRIDVSANGTSFTTAAQGTFTAADIGRRNVVDLPAAAKGVRFVRFVGLSTLNQNPPFAGSEFMGLTELQAYGTPTQVPPPLDRTPPQTSLRGAVIRPGRRTATFRFGSSETGSSFLCKLDRRAFAGCRSPKTYRRLKPGRHTFRVKAKDAAGNLDLTAAVRRFRIPRR